MRRDLAVLLVLGLMVLPMLGNAFASSGSYRVVVVNPYGYGYHLEIVCSSGATYSYDYSDSYREIYVSKYSCGEIEKVVMKYVLPNSKELKYLVKPMNVVGDHDTIYVTTFPPWFDEITSETEIGDQDVPFFASYSWYDIASYSNPWPVEPPWPVYHPPGFSGSPYGLEYMVGTEGCFVEEAMAGRIFVMFYDFAEPRVSDILDSIGVQNSDNRTEIAATALWAAQLVREAKEREPDFELVFRSAMAILIKYEHMPLWKAILASISIYYLSWIVHYALNYWDYDGSVRDLIYVAILEGIKSDANYVALFPEWSKVTESAWIAMCRRLEQYTVPAMTPTYTHTLVVGALAKYLGLASKLYSGATNIVPLFAEKLRGSSTHHIETAMSPSVER